MKVNTVETDIMVRKTMKRKAMETDVMEMTVMGTKRRKINHRSDRDFRY